MALVQKGIYRHYKGKFYEVLGIARHSETLEALVVYRALYKTRFGRNSLWVRPQKTFLQKIMLEGVKVPRFKFDRAASSAKSTLNRYSAAGGNMIKKNIIAAVLLNFVFAMPVFAEESTATWGQKLKRGAINIVSSPVEVARQIQITSNERSLLDGWTVGLVKGLGSGLMRLGVGAVELVTFPFDFPKENKEPILEPEYVWEKPGVKYS